MITITKKEEVVLDQIKIINFEYPDGIPVKVLRDEVDFHEYDLVEILKLLDEKDIVEFKDYKVKLTNNEEINISTPKKDLKENELSDNEKEAYDFIKENVNENNLASKNILEGKLLYGPLNLSNFKMYHITLSLQNKGFLKIISKSDGDYYLFVP